jgi:hypothetical protein
LILGKLALTQSLSSGRNDSIGIQRKGTKAQSRKGGQGNSQTRLTALVATNW